VPGKVVGPLVATETVFRLIGEAAVRVEKKLEGVGWSRVQECLADSRRCVVNDTPLTVETLYNVFAGVA
jgi:hypothetical protein